MSPTAGGPHSFRALRWWDERSVGRCRHCYLPRFMHPITGWTEARPLGDKRRPTVFVANTSARNEAHDA